jgi:hypothetical protein
MPINPPTYRPASAGTTGELKRERESRYRQSPKGEDRRIRGRKGVDLRQRRLAREPLCRHCAENGRVTAADVVDHIKPLAFGGTDTDDNVQCLCYECHAIKSALEGAAHGGAATHPDWLRPSAIPVTIVCGPPCAGKTTYVSAHASHSDRVIDLDAIALSIDRSYRPWTGMLHGELLTKSIRVRNAMLGALERAKSGKAWFIVSAPTQDERQWWADRLGGTVALLHPGVEECKRRARARGTPAAVAGVDEWELKASAPWEPRQRRVPYTD